MERPQILICNDDGIDAAGIRALAEAVLPLGNICVVAPMDEQSAVGHAITMRSPVRARPWPFSVGPDSVDVDAFAVKGTPADCVKIAIDKLLPRKPDLVVSGINHGANTAVNILYSGTVSAATEASILGIPAIAFSLCAFGRSIEFGPAVSVARQIVESFLKQGQDRAHDPGIVLNVNIPALPTERLNGAMITRQARARWEEEFVERTDPFNERYYWLSGTFVNLDSGPTTDLWAIDNGFVSITPIHHDLTAYTSIERLSKHEWLK